MVNCFNCGGKLSMSVKGDRLVDTLAQAKSFVVYVRVGERVHVLQRA